MIITVSVGALAPSTCSQHVEARDAGQLVVEQQDVGRPSAMRSSASSPLPAEASVVNCELLVPRFGQQGREAGEGARDAAPHPLFVVHDQYA